MKKLSLCLAMLVVALMFGTLILGCDSGGNPPPPPTNVNVMWLDRNRVLVTWDEVPGAEVYEIAFRTNLESFSTRRNIGAAHITSFTHSVHPSVITDNVTSLYYFVRAGRGREITAWVQSHTWADTGNPGAPGGGMVRPPE